MKFLDFIQTKQLGFPELSFERGYCLTINNERTRSVKKPLKVTPPNLLNKPLNHFRNAVEILKTSTSEKLTSLTENLVLH